MDSSKINLPVIAAILLLTVPQVYGQRPEHHTISGYVKEEETLPRTDSVRLIFSYVGYTPRKLTVTLSSDLELNIDLKA